MDEEAEAKSKNQNTKVEGTICEECKEKRPKYKCPGCSIHTCSLACVKAHKQRTGCSGKRNLTEFVPLSQFNDNILLSDYNLLEETKRVAESARRWRSKLCGYPYFKLPYFLRSLRSAAASRRTKLLFLPSGMTKREKNRTRYDQRKKLISWTIEWRFHSTDVILVDHGVQEDTNLCSVIENHLKAGPQSHQLKQYCEEILDHLRFFICKYPKGSRSPFRELDIKAPIRQQLSHMVILEYPVIYVFLPSHSCDFEVVRDTQPVSFEPVLRDPVNDDHGTPSGVSFKEEEIEDENGYSFTRVFDLMKHVSSSSVTQIPNHNLMSEKASSDLVKPLTMTGKNVHSVSKTEEPGIFEDMEFDFDQGLIDAYSDLISDINPDDFLDLESIFAKDAGIQARGELPDSVDYLREEELEEGEIAD